MFEYKSCRMYSNYDATFWPLRAVIDTIELTFKLKRANPQSIGRLGWIVGKGNVQVPIYFSKESEKKTSLTFYAILTFALLKWVSTLRKDV